jgi:ribonuclease-3
LASISRLLNLGSFLRLSKGEEKTGGREKRAILADLFESLVAAVYLDSDLETAREFVLTQFEHQLELLAKGELEFRDFKSNLQEELHRRGFPSPEYTVVEECGPDHNKVFSVAVSVLGKRLAEGSGGSKKKAEGQAAERAMEQLAQGDEIEIL